MSHRLVAEPAVEPIHVNEARQHIKQDIADDDVLIGMYIAAARQFAETKTRRQIVVARYQYIIDRFPGASGIDGVIGDDVYSLPAYGILLPMSPCVQVVSIQYMDMAGLWQTMPPSDYTVDNNSEPPRITPVFGKIWPIPRPQIGSVIITYDAGHVAALTASAVADTVTLSGWKDLLVGDVLRFTNSGGALPAPLLPNVDYYIQSVVASGVYKLTATLAGPAIDLTDLGTGQSFVGRVPEGLKAWLLVRVDSLYAHRGESALVKGQLEHLPWIDSMLDRYRVVVL